ncbi:MAG: hypothetical protein RL538_29 [Candidatus Parcubacteria bacterium]|jgi:hypothetical protein
MFRTRDYALMLATITFLLVGIAATALTQGVIPGLSGMSASVFSSTEQPETYEVITPEETEPSREDRISSLRKKIAALGLDEEVESQVEETVSEESPLPEVEEGAEAAVAVKECVNYRIATPAWSPRGLIIEEVEGARLVYREGQATSADTSSSSAPIVSKEIVLQLPVRSVPNANPSCLSTDIIGIAKDGSLIRNNEVGAYGVFGAGTLVGYALDGFPIYGTSEGKTDVCGGMMVGGQYRYVISAERETIINCFAGVPVSL